jgi:hypothetical protein
MDSLFPFLLHRDDDHDVRDYGRDGHDGHDGNGYGYDHDRVRDHVHDLNACVYGLHLFLQQAPSECVFCGHDYDRDHGYGHDDGRDCGHGGLMQNVRSQNISR